MYLILEDKEAALDNYKNAKKYRQAIEICRVIHPEEVITLEEVILFLTTHEEYCLIRFHRNGEII